MSSLLAPPLWPREKKMLIGMIHVQALPGTPANSLNMKDIVARAQKEALILEQVGFDMVCIENMFDTPYLRRDVGPEIVAGMTAVCIGVSQAVKIPFGIQILAGANKAALAVGVATGAVFIRCEGMVFSTVADEGIMDSDAGELLRYRRAIGGQNICIFADIKKKHSSHSLTSDLSIEEVAKAAHFFRLDGVIVTGTSTGEPARPEEAVSVQKAVGSGGLKILIGSRITPENLKLYWESSDAFIIGTYIKEGGHWENPVDRSRSAQIVEESKRLIQSKNNMK
ncbi:MAG: putative BtpA family membrane complex biogenesis protein [Streblomastix strix]|uniref:Putative BtpA family membrane complex biogenesis protein n=1 Tax=Streblomastix strix TaxID=222440 RepID=A0A5J4UTA9_9EUKA|nr:MAG: putative BtpA family membrane complex biogenesis protein [Streblomastix strix]